MSWVLVIQMIVSLIGPYIVEWLRKMLFEEAEAYGALHAHEPIVDADHMKSGVNEILDNVRNRLYFWQINKKFSVYVLRKIIEKKANEIFEMAQKGVYDDANNILSAEDIVLLKDAQVVSK